MRRSLLVCLVLLLCASLARADEDAALPTGDQRAIERVITGQIDAFRRDAGEAAFAFASPNIRAMFGDAPHFMAMVRQGYPPVYRPRSFAFDRLVSLDGRIVQRVRIVGPDGAAVLALYTMERQPNGSWLIDGCTLLKPDELRA